MANYAKISQATFEEIQFDAGNVLSDFDPATPATPDDEDIIAATTGGITITCQPQFSDWGEDIDNCPNNTKEMKHIDGYTCSIAFTDVRLNAQNVKRSVGAATITDPATGSATYTIKPKSKLEQTDFENAIWWVGPRAGGGGAAVKLINSLSTEGFSLKTMKNGKGQLSMTLTGHTSIVLQQDGTPLVPIEFYIFDAQA